LAKLLWTVWSKSTIRAGRTTSRTRTATVEVDFLQGRTRAIWRQRRVPWRALNAPFITPENCSFSPHQPTAAMRGSSATVCACRTDLSAPCGGRRHDVMCRRSCPPGTVGGILSHGEANWGCGTRIGPQCASMRSRRAVRAAARMIPFVVVGSASAFECLVRHRCEHLPLPRLVRPY